MQVVTWDKRPLKNEYKDFQMTSEIKEETINSRLKSLRKILRVTRSFIYDKYGLSQDTLKSWETDKIITQKGLEKCIKIYRNEGIFVTKEWILTGRGIPPKLSFDFNRYLSQEPCDNQVNDINEELLIIEEVEFFKNLSKNSIVILVKNTDMLPFYEPGDYVGGRFIRNRDIESVIGLNCIIKMDSENLIKRVIRNDKGGINLVITNPTIGSPNEPVIYNFNFNSINIAPICWHRKNFQ